MSKNVYDELMDKIENGNENFSIHMDGDKEDLLEEIEDLLNLGELSQEEYDSLVNHVEDLTCDIPDCIWEVMKICDPDLCD